MKLFLALALAVLLQSHHQSIDCTKPASANPDWNFTPFLLPCYDDKIRDPFCMIICRQTYRNKLIAAQTNYCAGMQAASINWNSHTATCNTNFPPGTPDWMDCIAEAEDEYLQATSDVIGQHNRASKKAREDFQDCGNACDCLDP